MCYESNPVDLIETGRYENISRKFLQVNPAATVPVLLHNGHPIYESHEQLKYVAEQVDQQGLLVPQDPNKSRSWTRGCAEPRLLAMTP